MFFVDRFFFFRWWDIRASKSATACSVSAHENSLCRVFGLRDHKTNTGGNHMYLRKSLVLFVCLTGLSFGEGNRLVVIKDGKKTTIGSQQEYEDIDRLNARRRSAGLRPLIVDQTLMAFARKWSLHQAKVRRMYHSGGKYRENVAFHSNGTAQVFDSMWHRSTGHRVNRMNSSIRKVGVGIVRAANGAEYATEVFSH
jgi:uncharacterized protein YkwD